MLIFAIRDPLKFQFSRHFFAGLAIVSLGLLWLYVRTGQSLAPHPITVQFAQVRDAEAMSYIVTYFLPFLAVSGNNWGDALSLLLIYAVVAVIYVNSNLIYINPMLNLAGYRLFEVVSINGKASTLITKRDYVPPHVELTVVSFGNYVLLERQP